MYTNKQIKMSAIEHKIMLTALRRSKGMKQVWKTLSDHIVLFALYHMYLF